MSWLPDIRLPDLLFLPGDSSSLLPSASAQAHASAKVWLPAQASASTPVSHLPASSKFLSSKVQNTLPPATASAWPIPASGSSVAAQPTLVFLHQQYDQRREVIALEQVKGTAESFLNERVLYSQLMVCVKVQDMGKRPCAHRAEEGATVSQWDHRIAQEADQHLVGSELSERDQHSAACRLSRQVWRHQAHLQTLGKAEDNGRDERLVTTQKLAGQIRNCDSKLQLLSAHPQPDAKALPHISLMLEKNDLTWWPDITGIWSSTNT